jgi:hypothetical protein
MSVALTMMAFAQAKPPEPLDREFLDYLAACESKDDNWTVVADGELRKRAEAGQKPKRPPVKDAKPEGVRP